MTGVVVTALSTTMPRNRRRACEERNTPVGWCCSSSARKVALGLDTFRDCRIAHRKRVQALRGARFACAPTQSPAMIAGLRRIATSLWLRFVASPQRMPIFRYRRWGRPVVSFIYKVPPRRRFLQHRLYLAAMNWGSARLHGVLHAIPDATHDLAPTRADPRIAPLAFPAYADPERVASASASMA